MKENRNPSLFFLLKQLDKFSMIFKYFLVGKLDLDGLLPILIYLYQAVSRGREV